MTVCALTRHAQQVMDIFFVRLVHPSYSPDLTSCDYHVLGAFRKKLGGQNKDAVLGWLQDE